MVKAEPGRPDTLEEAQIQAAELESRPIAPPPAQLVHIPGFGSWPVPGTGQAHSGTPPTVQPESNEGYPAVPMMPHSANVESKHTGKTHGNTSQANHSPS